MSCCGENKWKPKIVAQCFVFVYLLLASQNGRRLLKKHETSTIHARVRDLAKEHFVDSSKRYTSTKQQFFIMESKVTLGVRDIMYYRIGKLPPIMVCPLGKPS
jgi:hypothetical protein